MVASFVDLTIIPAIFVLTLTLEKNYLPLKAKRKNERMRGLINYYSSVGILVFMCIASKAVCDCNSVDVRQVRSGYEVNGHTEWTVTVTNSCRCPLSQVTLNCIGFMTAEAYPDVSIFSVQDDGTCLINGGNPLSLDESVFFSYAWNDIPFALYTQGSEGGC